MKGYGKLFLIHDYYYYYLSKSLLHIHKILAIQNSDLKDWSFCLKCSIF